MGAPASNNQAQYPEVLLIALELECCQLGRTRLILRDVNPIFNHHYLIPHHPLTWFVSFLYESSTFIKEYHCNKNGAKRSSTWPMPHFGPFPLKKIRKRGAKKGGKSALTKYTFQNSGWFGIIKEVLLSCFGMKRGPGWGVVACNVPVMWKLSAKIWTVFLSRPVGWSFWP